MSILAIVILAVAQLFVIRYAYRLKYSELEFVYRNVYEYASPFVKISWEETDALTQKHLDEGRLWKDGQLTPDYVNELQTGFLDAALIRTEIEQYFAQRNLQEEVEYLLVMRNLSLSFNGNQYKVPSGSENLILDGNPEILSRGNLVYRHIASADYLQADIELFVHFPNKVWLLIGEMKWVLILSTITFLLISYVAISNLRNWQRQKEISAIKDDLIDHISHEFRTPIASINIASDSIGNNGPALGMERVIEISQLIRRQGKRLQRMVDNLLNTAFLSQQQTTAMSPVHMDQFLTDYAQNIRLVYESEDLKLELHLQAPDITIQADTFLFESLLNNLVDNAVKYNHQAATIRIESEEYEGQYRLSIADNGIGIAADHLSGIFDKFQRYNQSSKGLGLGLYHVKQIVELHNGSISVESQVDQGTKFSISIPIR